MEISKSQYYRRYHIILAENIYSLVFDKAENEQLDYKIGETLNPTIYRNLVSGEDTMLSSIEKVCRYYDIDIIVALSNENKQVSKPQELDKSYNLRLKENLENYLLSTFKASSNLDELCENALFRKELIPPSPSDPKLQKSLLKKALEGKDLKLSSITRICDYFDIELEMLLKPVS